MSTIEEQLKERFATFERRRNGINVCDSGCSENISREQTCENSDYRAKAINEECRKSSQKSNLKHMDTDDKNDEKEKEEKNLKIRNITEEITKLVNEIQRHEKNIDDLSKQVKEEQEKKTAKEKRLQELTTLFRSLHSHEDEIPEQFEEPSSCAEETVDNVSFDEEIAKQLQAQYEREEEEEKHLEQERLEQEQDSARQRREQEYYQQFLKEQTEMEQEFARRNQYFQNLPEPSLIRQPQPYYYSNVNSNRRSARSSHFRENSSRPIIVDSDDDNTIHNYNARYFNN